VNKVEKAKVTIEAVVDASKEKVWECWTKPEHIVNWNSASDDWHSPKAENDLKPGGRFNYRMEAKDGSEGFDFTGTYDEVLPYERINYTMDDDRRVWTTFTDREGKTYIESIFEAENHFPVEMQKEGWQSILNRFKAYTESIAE
jgi:uncharacterized protein YndB with AHSA1/START domain